MILAFADNESMKVTVSMITSLRNEASINKIELKSLDLPYNDYSLVLDSQESKVFLTGGKQENEFSRLAYSYHVRTNKWVK